ncbi:ribonuclease HI [Aliarcobacter cryaerophilus ATCC 43158]|uniref:ribonuclease H n=1 Tax=Aliarcobacter cryaerophilus ATCC 43158 TaxID=1032070 RepID=A0AAD0XAB9_9BACT|nr:ribonuclease H family protein [Aliarcobacter cryaerophilus]AYJ79856.1 ribonuclease HI [Aliarcobacter cryaerophilus ATCC 43158]PRM96924.1 ribonuclease HI [Aliarcobacter cryaerophilus]QCZ24092.1 ribonuclease HI [Aliarcobacter cryaerophilus ATCC 43158]
MKIDKNFLSKIDYNGTLNKKQLDILKIDFSFEKNYENEALGKEISKNDSNLLMLLKGITDLECQEKIISNYHLVLEHNKIKANVYKNIDNNISTPNNILKIYCDGACSGNPGNAGSGIAVYFDDKNPVLLYGDFVEMGTNNIAELNALYKALQIANETSSNNAISIFTDSRYAIDCISTWAYSWKKNGWSKKGGEIKNLPLIIKSHELFEKLKSKVNLEYVKGHNGIEGNELADRMAINAIKQKSIDYKSFKYEEIEEVLKIK